MKPILRNTLFTSLCSILLATRVIAAGAPADAIQPNSVWKSESTHVLTIRERQGEKFRGIFTFPYGKVTATAEVAGEIKGNKISWLAKDARAISVDPGGDNFGTINGNRIDFTWRRRDNSFSGKFTLVRVPDQNQPPTPMPSVAATSSVAPLTIQTDADEPRIDVLKEQAPNAIEWALAPLEQAVPGDIRQNLTFLREDLLDEGKQQPKANAAAYTLGSQICNTLLATLEERNQTLVRAGFRAVEANARTGVTSEALEARRNYKMSWPQFAREESQRAELKSQAINGAAVMSERPKVEWATRTTALRKTLDTLYAQFREALRQGPAGK
jgi:hypothetical protein